MIILKLIKNIPTKPRPKVVFDSLERLLKRGPFERLEYFKKSERGNK